MNQYSKMAWALIISGLISTPLLADTGSGTSTTTPTTTTTTTTTPTATPTTTTTGTSGAGGTTTPSAISTINMTNNCAKGGTRSIQGSFDKTSGAIDLTATLAACVLRNGQTHDGTTSTKGTLLATQTGFDINLATNINTAITYKDGSTLKRTCDITKKGSFTHATQTFDGTETRNNCSLTGKVREHENIVEHLLRDLTKSEMDGGDDSNNRTLPMQAGERD